MDGVFPKRAYPECVLLSACHIAGPRGIKFPQARELMFARLLLPRTTDDQVSRLWTIPAHLLQAIATHGARYFYGSLLSVGLLYHLYNQVCTLPKIVADDEDGSHIPRYDVFAAAPTCVLCMLRQSKNPSLHGSLLSGRHAGVYTRYPSRKESSSCNCLQHLVPRTNGDLTSSGLQFAFNTLARVTPVSHGVCNVVKRVVIIATSVLFFGNKLTLQVRPTSAVLLLYPPVSSTRGCCRCAEPGSGLAWDLWRCRWSWEIEAD